MSSPDRVTHVKQDYQSPCAADVKPAIEGDHVSDSALLSLLPAYSSFSTPLKLLITILLLPFQALAIFIISKIVHQLVLCIDELYEVTGRRARSKFSSFPWLRVALGVLLMVAYHVGLFKLAIKSYRRLRKGDEG